MNTYCYDIECYPNFFSATFIEENGKDKKVFYIIDNKGSIEEFIDFLNKEMILIGYNCHFYDDPMLRFFQKYQGNNLNKDLFTLSNQLIHDNREDKSLLELKYPRKGTFPWKSIDLMRIMAFDVLGVSLKQTAINLKWKRIQDLPISFDKKIKIEDVDLILDYNENDVLITKELYHEIAPLRKLRDELSQLYQVDLSSASNSRIANLILESIYSKELKVDIKKIKELRTYRNSVRLSDCIASFVDFNTNELMELLNRIRATVVYSHNNYKYLETLLFAGLEFNLGIGGLHTNDSANIYVSDNNYLIQDMDVSSYYPNLIINNNFYPQHLGPNFITILKKITKERIEAKHSGNKIKADGLKITINSIFGKLGSDTSWLLDAKQMLSTTVSGQMGLLMLVESLYENGIEVISCNTDGIVCKIDRTKIDKYYEIAKEWEKKTKLELEFTPYKKYIRRDVNNYITVKEDGSTKEKGIFIKEIDLSKGYKMPIISKCLYEYFINNIPVRETINKSKDIMDFCISQKSGSNFKMELRTIEGTKILQKTNRFFISNRGGSLVKSDKSKNSVIGLYVGNSVTILNDYTENDKFENYDVNLFFYEKEALKLIEEIEPKQKTLFDISFSNRGSLVQNNFISNKIEEEQQIEKELTINEINKLGKNQLAKYVETIIKYEKKINGLDKRYVYVNNIDFKNAILELYVLSSGKIHKIKTHKSKIKKDLPVQIGNILYCNKFIKEESGEYLLDEYKITDKFDIYGVSII